MLATLVLVANTTNAQEVDCRAGLSQLLENRLYNLSYFCAGQRLAANENDAEAALVFARSALAIGQPEVAELFAEKAREFNLPKVLRFESFIISGLSNAELGKELVAKTYIRRAAQLAETDLQFNAVARAMSVARASSPWDSALSITFDPSSNVNNGSRHETETLFGIPGFTIPENLREQAGYTLNIDADLAHLSKVSEQLLWEKRVYANSQFTTAPAFHDYRIGVDSTLEYATAGDIPSSLSFTVGVEQRYQASAAGDPIFSNFEPVYFETNFTANYFWVPNDDDLWRVSFGYVNRVSNIADSLDHEIYKASASFRHEFSENMQVSFSGFWEDSISENAVYDRNSLGAGVRVDWRVEGYPVNFAVDIDYSFDQYHQQQIQDSNARFDKNYTLAIELTPREWQWFGFRPTFGISYDRQMSNIRRYDTVGLGAYTRIVSVF